MKPYKLLYKSLSLVCILFTCHICTSAYGQNSYDALRFSQLDYEGTARSMALGNAFTALGGDLGAIAINPASSGVFINSEITYTPSLNGTIDKSIFLGNEYTSNRTKFGMSNLGIIGTFGKERKSGLVSYSFGVVANQTANYSSKSYISGSQDETSRLGSLAASLSNRGTDCEQLGFPKDNPNYPFYNASATWEEILAWNTMGVDTLGGRSHYIAATENIFPGDIIALAGRINQSQYYETTGTNQHITFNFGGNISHKLYFGLNFTLQSIWYNKFIKYSERAEETSLFDTQFVEYNHYYNESVSSMGFNMKFGVIYRPIKGLRLGASIATPTWSTFTDENYEDMDSQVYGRKFSAKSPYNIFDYKLTSPFRWNAGVAYTFGKWGLISVDYENVNYGDIRFEINHAMSNGDIDYYTKENQYIKANFRNVHNLRAGIEIKPIERLSIRGGYSYLGQTTNDFDYKDDRHFASIGLGYRTKSSAFFDIAYRQQCNSNSEKYLLYDNYIADVDSPLVSSTYSNWKLLFTIGFRF